VSPRKQTRIAFAALLDDDIACVLVRLSVKIIDSSSS